MKRRAENTIKDIAQKLGLSPSTVSRGLKDHPHINEKTKKKIRDAAIKLGYKHNAIAASLRNNKSNIIGLIVPKISMFYQSAVLTAIQNKLHEYKYNLMVCQSNESVEIERELVNALYAARVEGLRVTQIRRNRQRPDDRIASPDGNHRAARETLPCAARRSTSAPSGPLNAAESACRACHASSSSDAAWRES